MWYEYMQKYLPKVLSSTFTPSLPFSLSPRLPCFLRSAWSRRRPLESEPRRVEDLELSEVLQPVDLEARIRAAQPRAPRSAELRAAAVLDGRGWVDLRAAAACGVAPAAGRAAAGGAASGSGAGPRPAQRNKAGGAARGAEARPQAGGAESRRSETSAVEQILRVKATVRPRIAAAA